MPKLSEVIGGERDCEALINGVVVQLTYDPNAYTPEAEAIWAETEKSQQAGKLAVEFLVRLLKYWDLEENDSSSVIPITVERMGRIPLTVLTGVMDGIFKDIVTDTPGNPTPNRAVRRASTRSRQRSA